MNAEEALAACERFHGHLGPYVVIGYRVGALARQLLGEGRMTARVLTGLKPPISCAVDGIQLSSGCTLGKGLIQVEERGAVEAEFTLNSKSIRIALKSLVKVRIDTEMSKGTERTLAAEVMSLPDDELLEVRRLD